MGVGGKDIGERNSFWDVIKRKGRKEKREEGGGQGSLFVPPGNWTLNRVSVFFLVGGVGS